MAADLAAVRVSNAAVTIRDLIDIGELMDKRTKGRAAYRLFQRRTSLTSEEILDLTGAEASELLRKIGDAFQDAAVARRLSEMWDASERGR